MVVSSGEKTTANAAMEIFKEGVMHLSSGLRCFTSMTSNTLNWACGGAFLATQKDSVP
ncbi:MAG: hypothetical protein CM1200mP10_22770 [Candidatus Neomarinimicrobiota bacterium]|nr:MAG: hypothetical protein CM1200mP10_22770 [Candidatus Neomarinimicrobiota bacterium]